MLLLPVVGGATIFAALVLVTIFRSLDPTQVTGYIPCSGGWHESELNQCQLGLLKIPQQPVNTYTNLAYLAVGLGALVEINTPASYVFALTMIYLSVGSSLYHAISNKLAGMLDVTAIFSLFSATAIYSLCVLIGGPDWVTVVAMFVGAGLATLLLSNRYKRNVRPVTGILLGATYLFLILRYAATGVWPQTWTPVISFVLFAIAFLAWTLDKRRKFPLKRWGHGVWHILTAIASGLLFLSLHEAA